MFLGKIHGELVEDFTIASLYSSVQGTVTVHDDETKGFIVHEKFVQVFRVKFVVAEVERGVDGFEGFKVNIDLFFLSLIRHNCATVND
jgi:hypothetical protein